MKLLLNENDFETLLHQLINGSKRYNIDAKLELYSCKMVAEEKKQYGLFLQDLGLVQEAPKTERQRSRSPLRDSNELPLNSSQTLWQHKQLEDVKNSSNDSEPSSPTKTGPKINAKDLFYLIGTLNNSFFPDYDFNKTKSTEFSDEPNFRVVERFISDFCSIYVNKYNRLKDDIWLNMDKVINLNSCQIYSYRPDHKNDPYSTGCLASFNYFFYNRLLKRVFFFSIRVLNDPISDDSDDI